MNFYVRRCANDVLNLDWTISNCILIVPMSITNPKKRELTDFFSPASPKRARICPPPFVSERLHTDHPHDSYTTYPFPVPYLPAFISKELSEAPSTESKRINDQADLDILYFQPFVSKAIANDLFQFIRRQLFFYRVQYKIKRGGIETHINTPRYTTVFGLDETSKFYSDGSILEASTSKPVSPNKYPTCSPRPTRNVLMSFAESQKSSRSLGTTSAW